MKPANVLRMRTSATVGAQPDFGAMVYRTTSQGLTVTPFDVNWTSEAYDYNGWHSTVTNTERLTVIAGVSIVRVTSNLSIPADDGAAHRKNGAVFYGQGLTDAEGHSNFTSAPIAVTAGDYFTTLVGLGDPAHSVGGDESTWQAIELLSSSLKYALVKKSGTQALSAGVTATLAFGAEEADTASFHDNVTNNSRLTVPSPITLVRVCMSVVGGSVVGQMLGAINKNGASARGLPACDCDTSGADPVNLVSAPLEVTTGDFFEATAFATTATTVPANESVWFSIEEVPQPATYQRALVYKSSGTQSFTGGAAAVAVTFDGEVYDTANIHDNSTNNSRLTVPAGCTKARPILNLKTASTAGEMDARVAKNGAVYQGQPFTGADTAGTDNLNAIGAWVEVSPGDYFEVFFSCATTTTLGTDDETWFCLECQ